MYRLEFTRAATKGLRAVATSDHKRIEGALILLSRDPHPPQSIRLRGRDGWRVRVGNYRIVYTVHDDVLLIVVFNIGHRRDVYDIR